EQAILAGTQADHQEDQQERRPEAEAQQAGEDRDDDEHRADQYGQVHRLDHRPASALPCALFVLVPLSSTSRPAKAPSCNYRCRRINGRIQENRRAASTALRPPKANELDSAAATSIRRASFGTTSRSQAGSGPR